MCSVDNLAILLVREKESFSFFNVLWLMTSFKNFNDFTMWKITKNEIEIDQIGYNMTETSDILGGANPKDNKCYIIS